MNRYPIVLSMRCHTSGFPPKILNTGMGQRMCQGLPCIGTTVLLRVDIPVGSDVILAKSKGLVFDEHLGTRELSVSFESMTGATHRVRVHETLIEVFERLRG
jgi:hypothetical protein